jgi:LPXTG-site transpeptidase (sortase) family protein
LEDAAPTVTRVTVPAIGVDATGLEALGLLPDGSLAAPVDFDRAGWFADGTVPGERGPAVVAGHVDSVDGPAVFYRLRELAPGDEVVVELSDGTAPTFRVDRVESAPKDDFPTAEVYGPTPDAQLRLITCGGEFDRSVRSYEDNTIVFASRVSP